MELFQTPDIQAHIDALAPRNHLDAPPQPIGDASLRALIPRPITKMTCNRLAGQLEFLINLRINGNVPRGRQTDFLYEPDPTTLICGAFMSNLDTPRRRETIEKVNAMPMDPNLCALYPNSHIIPHLVSLRWLRTMDIPIRYRNAYADAPLIGIADFLESIGKHFDVFTSYEAYSEFLLTLANRLEA
jgi:hypothetical protein